MKNIIKIKIGGLHADNSIKEYKQLSENEAKIGRRKSFQEKITHTHTNFKEETSLSLLFFQAKRTDFLNSTHRVE